MRVPRWTWPSSSWQQADPMPGMFETLDKAAAPSASAHAGQAGPGAPGVAARGADRVPIATSSGASSGTGGGQSWACPRTRALHVLRPRLDRHGPQHGPPYPGLRDDPRGWPTRCVVKTGFGTSIRKRFDLPMPDAGELGDRHPREARGRRVRRPGDPRRFLSRATTRSPAWATASSAIARLGRNRQVALGRTFPVFGSVIRGREISPGWSASSTR